LEPGRRIWPHANSREGRKLLQSPQAVARYLRVTRRGDFPVMKTLATAAVALSTMAAGAFGLAQPAAAHDDDVTIGARLGPLCVGICAGGGDDYYDRDSYRRHHHRYRYDRDYGDYDYGDHYYQRSNYYPRYDRRYSDVYYGAYYDSDYRAYWYRRQHQRHHGHHRGHHRDRYDD